MINTNEVLQKHNIRLTKTLGQNFLTDINIIRKIVNEGSLEPSDLVLEVGPGIGSMTLEIAKKAGRVLAVEIDKRLIPALEENLSGFPNVLIINEDIMKLDFGPYIKDWKGSLKVISNLPYYITTPIIMMLLESETEWDTLIFMVQKEVAMRMAAEPGTKDYGSLSVAVKYYSEPKLCFTVSRNCFIPKPDVDSAVVRLRKRELPYLKGIKKDFFFKVVRAAFSQRRKTLLNSLGTQTWLAGGKDALKEILTYLNLKDTVRAEELSLKDFARLARSLEEYDTSQS